MNNQQFGARVSMSSCHCVWKKHSRGTIAAILWVWTDVDADINLTGAKSLEVYFLSVMSIHLHELHSGIDWVTQFYYNVIALFRASSLHLVHSRLLFLIIVFEPDHAVASFHHAFLRPYDSHSLPQGGLLNSHPPLISWWSYSVPALYNSHRKHRSATPLSPWAPLPPFSFEQCVTWHQNLQKQYLKYPSPLTGSKGRSWSSANYYGTRKGTGWTLCRGQCVLMAQYIF